MTARHLDRISICYMTSEKKVFAQIQEKKEKSNRERMKKVEPGSSRRRCSEMTERYVLVRYPEESETG